MNIILCEGKTDAILISYLLIESYGYKYKNTKELPPLPVDQNQQFNFYEYKTNKKLKVGIWAVGGIDRIQKSLELTVERNRSALKDSERFSKIVVIFDSDTRDESKNLEKITEWLSSSNLSFSSLDQLQLGEWRTGSFQLKNASTQATDSLEILFIVLPPDEEGDLETFLLNSLSEMGESEKTVVEKSGVFINEIPDNPFFPQHRLRSKAQMGAVLSVFSPDMTFDELDRKLKQIPWTHITAINEAFSKLNYLNEVPIS